MSLPIIRIIQPEDNSAIANVIREVSAEHGLTADKGYGVADPNLDDMFNTYNHPNACYWVIEINNQILGGGGYAPLAGQEDVCELQKMYFSPQLRRLGLAKKIVSMSCQRAKELGFKQLYLESTANLTAAIHLYEQLGFKHLSAPLGNTGHDACEVVMLKEL